MQTRSLCSTHTPGTDNPELQAGAVTLIIMGRAKELQELKELLHLLRLVDRQQYLNSSPVPIFVSLDLEVLRNDRSAFFRDGSVPYIKELGIAILDTRRIFTPEAWPPLGMRQIDSHQFSMYHASSDFQDCDFTDFRECVFAETFLISQDQVVSTLDSYPAVERRPTDCPCWPLTQN
jgi:hypothetical protein